MVSKSKVTAKDATTDQKGVSLLSTDQKTIVGEDSASNVTPSSLKAKLGDQTVGKIAVGAGIDQVIKWVTALSSDNSISITYNPETGTIDFKATGSGGDPNIIMISDETTITRIAEDRTIYIIENTKPVRSTLELPAATRLGFWFRVINIHDGCNVIISQSGGQTLKYRDTDNNTSLSTNSGWDDVTIFCFEENKRFKWLTFA